MSSNKLLAALQQRKQNIQQQQSQQSAPTPSKPQQQPQQKNTAPASSSSTSTSKKKKKQNKRKLDEGSTGANEEESAMSDAPAVAASASTAVAPHAKKQKTNAATSLSSAPAPQPKRHLSALQQKMASKLAGARFRMLNEKLYTCTGSEAFEYFTQHPEEFDEYHRGFGVQAKEWPESPLDGFITYLAARSPSLVVGDFGCGEARLAESVRNTVHSFDLVAHNDRVTACNMSAVPLADATLDVAIFCLSLMGVDYLDFIREAHRTLRDGATLLISEVRSRFKDASAASSSSSNHKDSSSSSNTNVNSSGLDAFIRSVVSLGFQLKRKDEKNQMFVTMEFSKIKQQGKKKKEQGEKVVEKQQETKGNTSNKKKGQQQQPQQKPAKSASSSSAPTLNPCIYKKR